MFNQINPTKESIKNLAASYPKDTPVTMLNILRFKTKVDDGSESGLAVYQRYGALAQAHLKGAGAKVVWAGEVVHTIIGNAAQQPHQVLLIEYPSVDHFLSMILSEAYQAITHDRTIALEYGGLLACQQISK